MAAATQDITTFAKERYGLQVDFIRNHEIASHSKEQIRAYLNKLYIDDQIYEDFMKEVRFLMSREFILEPYQKITIQRFLFQLEYGMFSCTDDLIVDYFLTFIKFGSLFPRNTRRRLFPYKDSTHVT